MKGAIQKGWGQDRDGMWHVHYRSPETGVVAVGPTFGADELVAIHDGMFPPESGRACEECFFSTWLRHEGAIGGIAMLSATMQRFATEYRCNDAHEGVDLVAVARVRRDMGDDLETPSNE